MVEEYRDRVRINRYYVFFLFFFFHLFYRLRLDNIPTLRPAPFPLHFSSFFFNVHSREFYFLRVTFKRTSPFERKTHSPREGKTLGCAHAEASNSRSEKHTRSGIVFKKCADSHHFLSSSLSFSFTRNIPHASTRLVRIIVMKHNFLSSPPIFLSFFFLRNENRVRLSRLFQKTRDYIWRIVQS